jgi:predicted negative regulator of RcsB-dependent stress response
MILELIGALIGSTAVRYALAAVLALGGYQGWKYYQQHEGAKKAIAKIEKKANENVKTAEAVRDAVATGRRGLRDPSRRDAGH